MSVSYPYIHAGLVHYSTYSPTAPLLPHPLTLRAGSTCCEIAETFWRTMVPFCVISSTCSAGSDLQGEREAERWGFGFGVRVRVGTRSGLGLGVGVPSA